MKHVAVAIIINSKNEVLITGRLPNKPYADKFEFPGGKVEAGETVFQALQRELLEEVQLHIHHAEPFMQVEHQYPEFKVLLDIHLVKQFSGIAVSNEGQAVRWVKLHDLPQANLLEANQPIIQSLLDKLTGCASSPGTA